MTETKFEKEFERSSRRPGSALPRRPVYRVFTEFFLLPSFVPSWTECIQRGARVGCRSGQKKNKQTKAKRSQRVAGGSRPLIDRRSIAHHRLVNRPFLRLQINNCPRLLLRRRLVLSMCVNKKKEARVFVLLFRVCWFVGWRRPALPNVFFFVSFASFDGFRVPAERSMKVKKMRKRQRERERVCVPAGSPCRAAAGRCG